MWYAVSAGGVRSVTVHAVATSAAFQVQEFAGAANSNPLDASIGASSTSTTPGADSINVPAGELVVGFVAGHGSG